MMGIWQTTLGGMAVALTLSMAPLAATPAMAADAFAPQAISKTQRCPVCGMFPARYPAWATQVVFKDNSMTALESPAELFRFLADVKKYDAKHSAADIARIYATDYAKRDWIDAKQAFYVDGSKVKGPMGADLPAFATKAAAEGFAKESGGRVLGFDEVAPDAIKKHAEHGEHNPHAGMKH